MAESRPLLDVNDDDLLTTPPSYAEVDENKPNDSGPPLPVGQDELPPPYTPNAYSQPTHVNCKVCQAAISLEGRHHLYVIKCSICNEATPIKNAPPGKKYVRCPCNCLLMCSVGAVRIACPRENCRRMIALQAPTVQFASTASVVGQTVRARCAHCDHIFVFLKSNVKHKLAICPQCRLRSAVGYDFIKRKALLFAVVGLFFVLLGVITTVVSVYTAGGVGVYIVWIGAYVIGMLNILRAALYFCVKVSKPLD